MSYVLGGRGGGAEGRGRGRGRGREQRGDSRTVLRIQNRIQKLTGFKTLVPVKPDKRENYQRYRTDNPVQSQSTADS